MVEGYDEHENVICSVWVGISRDQAAFPQESLERLPPEALFPAPRR
jgi:hypothetical protein